MIDTRAALRSAMVVGVMLSTAIIATHAQDNFILNHATSAERELDQDPSRSEPQASPDISTGSISGTVLSKGGAVLQGAQVTLTTSTGTEARTASSGDDGQFVFKNLPPGTYILKVTGQGMSTFTAPEITLRAGEVRILPSVTLAVSGSVTSVTVTDSKEELADEQVRIAVQQRIGGIIPNFYSSYDWNAPSMQAKQKFKLSIRSVLDPVSFLTVAGIAGAEQYQNIYPDFGTGLEGYGKRYGAAFANHATATMFGRAVYPSIFHQDPRYFYKGRGSIGSRALYAVEAAVVTRGDDGRLEPNYSIILGNFSSAAMSNLYYPESDEGVSLVITNGLAATAADAAANLIREFVLKGITSHIPPGPHGQP